MDQGQKQNENLFFDGYKETLCKNIISFFNRKAFVNVTLICNGESIKAHQVILAACSPFFENILMACSEPNPTLVFTDIQKNEMILLLEYMYKGQISVAKDLVPSLLKTAKKLQIRGLVQHVDNSQENLEDVAQDDNVRQNSSQVLIGTLEQNAQVPAEDQITSLPGCTNLPNDEVTRWLSTKYSLSKKRGHDKVPNPFANESRCHSDSDSTQFNFNLSLSKNSCTRKISTPVETDSDVEFIDDSTVMVISDTQNKRSPEIRTRVPKRTWRRISSGAQFTQEDFTSSDESSVGSKLKKNSVGSHDKKSDETSTVKVNPVALRNRSRNKENQDEDFNQFKKDGVRRRCDDTNQSKRKKNEDSSPLRTKKKGLTQNEKEATKSTMSEDSSLPHTSKEVRDRERKKKLQGLLDNYSETPVEKLRNYCLVCKKFMTNCQEHIYRTHRVAVRKKRFFCPTCCKRFYFKSFLEMHKCQPLMG